MADPAWVTALRQARLSNFGKPIRDSRTFVDKLDLFFTPRMVVGLIVGFYAVFLLSLAIVHRAQLRRCAAFLRKFLLQLESVML